MVRAAFGPAISGAPVSAASQQLLSAGSVRPAQGYLAWGRERIAWSGR